MCQLLSLVLLVLTTSMNASKSSICVQRGIFADIRGPYEHLIFNDTLNGDVYQYPRPQSTQYLYPFILSNADYYYMISTTLYDSNIHSFCYIGYIADLGSNYLFDVKDCQYWAFYNGTKGSFQIAADMIVSECQFDDICIEGSIYLPFLNTYYKYQYWNYTVNGAVYYNNITNKYVYPYLQQIDNKTNAKYIIDSVRDNAFANAYCGIGSGVPWYYLFDFKHCTIYRAYHQLQWSTELNMTVGTNCTYTNSPTTLPTQEPTNDPTPTPTKTPTFNPTVFVSFIPTNSPTELTTSASTDIPTNIPTNQPNAVPTLYPTNSHSQYPSIYQTKVVSPTKSPTNLPSTVNSASNTSAYPSNNATVNIQFHPTFAPTSPETTSIVSLISVNAEADHFFRTNNNILWYIVAAIIVFVALITIMICCLYVKMKKLIKTTSEVSSRQQRVESDISMVGSLTGLTPPEIRTFIPVQIHVANNNNNNDHSLNNAVDKPLPIEMEANETETDEREMDDMFGEQQHEGEKETFQTEHI